MKKVIFLLVFVFSAPSFAHWDLNDVSYLMPLPKIVGHDQLIKTETLGANQQALLPVSMLDQVPPITMSRNRTAIYEYIRVVGVRIDPCFPYPTLVSCQKQIRLVWQPIQKNRFDEIVAIDASLHTFYELNEVQFSELVQNLKTWKKKYQANTTMLPLQVHPAWAAEQDQAPALQEFNELILKHISMDNMMRLTFMVLRGHNDMWMFAAMEPKNGKYEIIPIPRLDRPAQAFRNSATPPDKYEFTNLGPAPQGADTINYLISDSNALSNDFDNVVVTEMDAAYRIENPKIYNSENMDCVSCHTARGAIEWATKNRAGLMPAHGWSKDAYLNFKFNVQNISPVVANTQNLRAFGYFGSEVALSQRMINETADVAEQMNHLDKE